MKKNTILFLLFIAASITVFSQSPRPREVWAFRSVLDGTPRILNLELHKGLSIAYNTQSGNLFKIWAGDVVFDGAVYTKKHGPQPSSEGFVYFNNSNSFASPFTLYSSDSIISYSYQYKGHKIINNQAILTHELKLKDGSFIIIEESPEYIVQPKSENSGLERSFTIKSNPQNLKIVLNFELDNITIIKKDITATSPITYISKAEKIRLNQKPVYSVIGSLPLSKSTTLTSYFTITQ